MRSIQSRGFIFALALVLLSTLARDAKADPPVFLAQWNSGSSGPFSLPCAVAVAPGGEVYVADTWFHRVQKFGPSGENLGPWGGDQGIAYTMGIAVDAFGTVYVSDYGNSRVLKFNSSGVFQGQFGSYGTGNGQFTNTGGVAVDQDGFVYVIDLVGQRIEKFTNAGSFVLTWGGPGAGDGQFAFTWPSGGIAVAPDGSILVSDAGNNRIQKFTSQGVFVTKWGTGGSGQGELASPRGLSVDLLGRVYVAEEGNRRIQVFTSDASFLTAWGGSGDSPGFFSGPRGVAVGADGAIYVADTGNNRIQLFSDPTQQTPTTTTLTTSPGPTYYGETVSLTASVTPSDAQGNIAFSDGDSGLALVPVVSGTASHSTSSLLHGSHSLKAAFIPRLGWAGSMSAPVVHEVQLLPTSVVLVSSADPSAQHQAISFTATVSVTAGPSLVPTGSVQFELDGSPLGTPVALQVGGATSPPASALSVGQHVVTATYVPLDTFRFAPSTAPALTQHVDSSAPVIVSVRDVPNDQGGKVFLTWRCILDQPAVQLVTGYRIWRRIPTPGASAFASGAPDGAPETFWEAIALQPAAQLVSYGYTAATTQDSLAGSNPYTAFFVQALTADPFVSYGSDPDSGYSVDNLSPPTPAAFTVNYGPTENTLHWRGRATPDLLGYEIHRGSSSQFAPSEATLVATTSDTAFIDLRGSHYYKLAAIDVHGNRSRFAAVSPELPVATLAAFVSMTREQGRIRVLWYSGGNAGLPATVYRRTEGQSWEKRAEIRADGNGYLAFEDDNVLDLTRYGYRLGVAEPDEAESYFGEAWTEPLVTRFELAAEGANPSSGGRISLRLSSPVAGAATLQLFDVAGREVEARRFEVAAGAPERISFGDARPLRPGVYLIRASCGAARASRRVVVVN